MAPLRTLSNRLLRRRYRHLTETATNAQTCAPPASWHKFLGMASEEFKLGDEAAAAALLRQPFNVLGM
jgi:hypothetical protein